LASVVPKDFAAELEGARSQVDFFLNMLILLPPIAIAAVVHGVATTSWTAVIASLAACGPLSERPADDAWIAVGAMIAWPFLYRSAVRRALAWGEVVMAAFDVFLPKLTTQLGYQAPASESDRKALWEALNKRMVFREAMAQGPWKLAGAETPPDSAAPPNLGDGRSGGDDAGDDVEGGGDGQ